MNWKVTSVGVRSAYLGNQNEWYTNSSGNITNNNPNNQYRLAPDWKRDFYKHMRTGRRREIPVARSS